MSRDRKGAIGRSPRKESFMTDNRWTNKRRAEDEAAIRDSTPLQQLEVEREVEIESGIVFNPSATPTRSEENVQI